MSASTPAQGARPGFAVTASYCRDPPQPFVAASRLAYCRFSYFQMNPDTLFRGGGWVDAWSDPNMPSAVHIEMAPAVADPVRLPVVNVTAPQFTTRFYDDPKYDDYGP